MMTKTLDQRLAELEDRVARLERMRVLEKKDKSDSRKRLIKKDKEE